MMLSITFQPLLISLPPFSLETRLLIADGALYCQFGRLRILGSSLSFKKLQQLMPFLHLLCSWADLQNVQFLLLRILALEVDQEVFLLKSTIPFSFSSIHQWQRISEKLFSFFTDWGCRQRLQLIHLSSVLPSGLDLFLFKSFGYDSFPILDFLKGDKFFFFFSSSSSSYYYLIALFFYQNGLFIQFYSFFMLLSSYRTKGESQLSLIHFWQILWFATGLAILLWQIQHQIYITILFFFFYSSIFYLCLMLQGLSGSYLGGDCFLSAQFLFETLQQCWHRQKLSISTILLQDYLEEQIIHSLFLSALLMFIFLILLSSPFRQSLHSQPKVSSRPTVLRYPSISCEHDLHSLERQLMSSEVKGYLFSLSQSNLFLQYSLITKPYFNFTLWLQKNLSPQQKQYSSIHFVISKLLHFPQLHSTHFLEGFQLYFRSHDPDLMLSCIFLLRHLKQLAWLQSNYIKLFIFSNLFLQNLHSNSFIGLLGRFPILL